MQCALSRQGWPHTPPRQNAAVFFDGRNIRYAATRVFGCKSFADFHPGRLAGWLCARQGWRLVSTRFYIGVPADGRVVGGETANAWQERASRWEQSGVHVCTRTLAGNNRERGIDLRIGFDMLRVFRTLPVSVIVIASADQDFREAVAELRDEAALHRRGLTIATIFPQQGASHGRGIDTADLHLGLSAADFALARD